MALGQKHIPQPQLARFGLELFNHSRVRVPALFAVADLLFVEGVGWEAFLFDEFLDLICGQSCFLLLLLKRKEVKVKGIPTRSRVFLARSLT